jgi:hypothetical protein
MLKIRSILLSLVLCFILTISGYCEYGNTGGTITVDGIYTIHTFTADGTFTPIVNGNIQVEAWGGGAGGRVNGYGCAGGGGGAYARTNSVAVTGGTGYSVDVGDSVSDEQDGNPSTFNVTTVVAAGGDTGVNDQTGGLGGSVDDSTGADAEFAGGNGGPYRSGYSEKAGGGGCAGPDGVGLNGTIPSLTSGGDGGDGDNGSGGAGGNGGYNNNGQSGGSNVLGGGGGGGGDNGYEGGNGGNPGGGGGGGETDAGNGARGQIIIKCITADFQIPEATGTNTLFLFTNF